ncbi:MAG: LacI family DNA-binding transcriptional regulator [Christensenellaceae bacterium]
MQRNNRRVTIKDVASSAGISIGTVSRVISNKGYVSKEAREKIERAIKELNYIPNTAARSMINKTSKIVGVIVPEINNPFLADLVVKIEACLTKKNYSILLCNSGYSAKKIATFIDDLIMRNADGMILIATDISEKKVLDKIKRYLHGVSVGQKLLNFDCINFTDYKSAYDITNYLIDIGHEKIACIGFNANASQTVERLDGVMTALKDRNLPVVEDYLIEYEVAENGGYICAKKLLELENAPTAIVAINDFYAIGAYEAIFEKGLKVGDDISVVGFDDIGMAKFISPPLTTVNCDTHRMAELATELLMKKIDSGFDDFSDDVEGKEVLLPSKIMIRESIKSSIKKDIDKHTNL